MNSPARLDASQSAPARFTAAEFTRIFDSALLLDVRLELVNGRLERMTPPMGGHSSRQTATVTRLWALVRDRAMVEATVDLGENTVMTCDIAVLRAPMTEQRFLTPDEVMLAIEIAETTSLRNTTVKRVAYAAAGIPTYWVVDGRRSVVQLYEQPLDGDYAKISTIRFGEPIAVPGTDATIVID